MTWLKVDDGFDEHPKIEALSDRSFRLHMAGLCLCSRKLSDGHISKPAAKGLLARLEASKRHVEELVAGGLWIPHVDGGYMVNDFLDYNRSKEDVEAERERARTRMKKLRGSRERSGEQPENNQGSSGGGSPSPTRPVPRTQGLDSPPTSILGPFPLHNDARDLIETRGPDNSPLGKLRVACRVLEGSEDEWKLKRAMRGLPEAAIVDLALSCPADVRDRLGWTLSELKRRKERAA